MKYLQYVLLIILLGSCAAIGSNLGDMISGQGVKFINKRTSSTPEEYKEEVSKMRTSLKEKYKNLKETSTAQVIRGKKKFKIDLKKKSDVAKIKDKDIIELEKGYYSFFPIIRKEILVKGISQLDTLIGDNYSSDPKEYLTLRENNVVFTNLTMTRIRFSWGDDKTWYKQTPHQYTLIQCHVYDSYGSDDGGEWVGNTTIGPYANVRLVFSKAEFVARSMPVYPFKKISVSPFDSSKNLYSYYRTIDSVFSDEKFYKFIADGEFGNNYVKNPSEGFTTDKGEGTDIPSDLLAIKNFKENEFLTIYPELANAFKDRLIERQRFLESKKVLATYQVDERNKNKIFFEAFSEINKNNGGSTGSNESSKYIAMAKEAAGKGRVFTAALATSLALEKDPFSKNVQAEHNKYLSLIANKYGCSKSFSGVKNPEAFNSAVRGVYPILGLNAKKSPCKLTYRTPADEIFQVMSPEKVVTTEYVWKETEESLQKKWSLENARRQAEADYTRARFNKNINEIEKAGKSFARTRARITTIGGSQYMVYGKGNLTPKEDKILKFQENQAKKNLEKLGKEKVNPNFEKKTNTITKEYLLRTERYQGELLVKLPTQQDILIQGPVIENKSSKTCLTRRDHLGRVLTNSTGGNECNLTTIGNNYFLSLKYIPNEILSHIATPMYGFYFSKFTAQMDKLLNSSDLESKLEGNLMGMAFNYDETKDKSVIEKLSKSVIGESVTYDKAVGSITTQN